MNMFSAAKAVVRAHARVIPYKPTDADVSAIIYARVCLPAYSEVFRIRIADASAVVARVCLRSSCEVV